MIAHVCYCTTHSVQVGHLPSASERVWLAGLQGMGRIFNRQYEKHFPKNVEGCRDGSAKNHRN